MDWSSVRVPYFASLSTYTLRAPRKGNARQRRRVVRRRIRIAVLTKRLGGNVVVVDWPLRRPRGVPTVRGMSDPKTTPPSPRPCCAATGEPLTDAQRAESAEFLLNAMRDRCAALAKELADAQEDLRDADDDTNRAESEIEALREERANDLTRDHRDFIRSQAMAMLSADTRLAVASSSLSVFAAIGEPFISAALDDAAYKIGRGLRGMGKVIGRVADDPDVRSGFLAGLITSLADHGINLADMIGAVTAGIPDAPSVYPPKVGADPGPAKPASPIATPGDAKPDAGVTAKKRAPKRKA